MKIAVAIMTTDAAPYSLNYEAASATFISGTIDMQGRGLLKHEYRFYPYKYITGQVGAGEIVNRGGVSEIHLTGEERISHTFEKTLAAFEMIDADGWDPDVVVKINGSAYLNVRLLDELVAQMDGNKIYCNKINTIISDSSLRYVNDVYPRGDFTVYPRAVWNAMIPAARVIRGRFDADDMYLDVPHTDDVLFGVALVDSLGGGYCDRLVQLGYSFCPEWNMDDFVKAHHEHEDAVCARLKSIPPSESHSGYSWKDNEYRRTEPAKMEYLYMHTKDKDYAGIRLDDVVSTVYTNVLRVDVRRGNWTEQCRIIKAKRR